MKKNAAIELCSYLQWFIPPALLSLFTFLVYYPTLRYGFVFDDFPTILEYIHARTLDVKGLFFNGSRWISRLLNQYTFTNWRDNPFSYRIFDVILHIVIGIMVFVFVAKLLSELKKNDFLQRNSYAMAILVAGLFLLHPVQTQTVTYITQMRLEGLVVFFVFAVLLCFLYGARTVSHILKYFFYGCSFIFAAFATGSKEIIITLPLLIILVDWFFIAEGDWEEFKSRIWVHGCFVFIVVGLLSRFGIAKPKNIITAATTPVHNNRGNVITALPAEFITTRVFFISQFKVILHYMGIFFWPVGLCFDYGYKLARGFFSLDVIVPLLGLCGIAGSTLYLFIKNRINAIVFAVCWFFCTILPRASIFPGTELVCDYKTYIASFGMFFFIAIGILYATHYMYSIGLRLYQLSLKSAHYIALCCWLFICLGIASKERNNVWCTEETFWRDVVDKNPLDARAWNNYAVAMNIKGDEQNAIKYFEKSLEVDNFYAEPHINLATLYQIRGMRDKAYAHYVRALEIGEAHPELFNNLGMFHLEEHGLEQAEHCFKEAVNLRSSFSRAWKNLGDLYVQTNRAALAEECYDKALNGDMIDNELIYSHGIICYNLGKLEKAIVSFNRIIDKDYNDTAFYLGAAYFALRKYADACKYLESTYKKNPHNTSFAYNYALVLLNIGQPAEAMPLFKLCMSNNREHQYAGLHYGRCLFEIGKKEEAKKHLVSLLHSCKETFVKGDVVSYMKDVKLS
jgi:tetratricopeptide (TPR) repeat protein